MKAQDIGLAIRDERGNALVLSLLILVSLTSVGVLSLQRTGSDLAVSTNISRQGQALMGSEAGLMHGVSEVGPNTQEYINKITTKKEVSQNHSRSYKVMAFSTANSDSTSRLPVIGSMGSQWSRIPQDLGYDVTIHDYGPSGETMGNDVSSEFTFRIFDVIIQGAVPTGVQSGGQSMDQTLFQSDTMVVRTCGRILSGPVKK